MKKILGEDRMVRKYKYKFERPTYKGWYRLEDAKGTVVLWGIRTLETAKKHAAEHLKEHPNKRVITITKDEGKVTKYVK